MTPAFWKRCVGAVLALLVLGAVFTGSRLLRGLESVRQVQALVLDEEALSTRFHRDGAALVGELHSAVLRLGTPSQPQPSVKDEVEVLYSRSQAFFGSPPVHLVASMGEGLAAVRSQLALYRERTEEWLKLPAQERLEALPVVQDTHAALLREIHAVADSGSQQLYHTVVSLQDSLAEMRLLLFLSMLGLVAALGGLFWLVTRAWLRPLLAQVAVADAQAAAQRELASLGVLAAGLAHEIRNPVGALKNRAYALGLLVDPGQNLKAAQQIASMNGELERVERIVRDFLDYARPQPPRLEEVVVREWLENFIAGQRGSVEERGIVLETRWADEVGDLRLQADPGQLHQVLLNLLRNALEAAESSADRAWIEVSATVSHGFLEIRVLDKGPGVPADLCSQIFTPFATGKRRGTGLGLPISRSIARQHGGELLLEPQAAGAEGASFLLRIPCGTTAQALPGAV